MLISVKELNEAYSNDVEIIKNWLVKTFKADTVLYSQMGLILRDYEEGSEFKLLGSEYLKLMAEFKDKTDAKTKIFSINGIYARNKKIIVKISRKNELEPAIMQNIV